MFQKEKEYYCVNCGAKTKSLYKKYSETVLKLSECEECKQIADKYVEYDLVIIIIDLVLFNTQAYRHILLNSEFKHYWKLSLVLILVESYCKWALSSQNLSLPCEKNETEPSLNDFEMNIEDIRFYIFCINITFGFLCFVLSIYAWTKIYQKYFAKNKAPEISFVLVLKMMTLASTGIFLQLPSVIWDITLYSYHLHFITLYTCLSQLLAYRVISNCPKAWSLVAVFSSHYLKTNITTHMGSFLENCVIIK